MRRLLFAAARGARLQSQAFGQWKTCSISDALSDNLWNQRQCVHPDDEHLQYGPISTAVRAWAFLNKSGVEPEYTFAARAICEEIEPDWFVRYDDYLHRSLFLLLLSEALADEGL